MVSIIIPSRKEKYLNKTVLDILNKAEGEIEIIIVLDGYWEKEVISDKRVKYLHNGKTFGMRSAINRGVSIATGKYLMKCDAHVMFNKGFDTKLIENHKTGRVQVPTRKRLDPVKWEIIEDGRRDVNYMSADEEFKARIDKEKNDDESLDKIKIDKIEGFQGSCWFMRKRYYDKLGLLDAKNWGEMGHEATEIRLKVEKAGGEVVRNKNTWYAHWHKSKEDLTFPTDRKKSRKYIKEFTQPTVGIIYYSANKEKIEDKVIKRIKEQAGDMPIVSVTFRPTDLGKNIVVGEHFPSDHNIYRQIQIACQNIDTEYVLSCESDCLYPDEYFQFKPDGKDIYRYSNIQMLLKNKDKFYKKKWSESGQIAKREYLLKRLEKDFEGKKMWAENEEEGSFKASLGIYKDKEWDYFGKNAIINIKTGDGLRPTCGVEKETETTELPYWGNIIELRRNLYEN